MAYVTYQGREEERPHPGWQAGTAYLPGTGQEIPLPRRLRLRVRLRISRKEIQRERFLDGRERGLSTILFNKDTRQFEVEVGMSPLRNRTGKTGAEYYNMFCLGHEEGHAYEHTGNVELLYEEAGRLGYEFRFFSRELAQESDAAWRWFHEHPTSFRNVLDVLHDYAHTKQEYYDLLAKLGKAFRPIQWAFRDYETTEGVAHVGGLVALVKANAPRAIVNKAQRLIEKKKHRA